MNKIMIICIVITISIGGIFSFFGFRNKSKVYKSNKIENKENTTITTNNNDKSIKVIIPAYFYPGPEWYKLTNALSINNNIIAIANPNNGAGEVLDINYLRTFDKFTNAGGKIVGYVYTQYGNRNIDIVKKDIDKWFNLYGKYISGIFLDEQSNLKNDMLYYTELNKYIKDKYNVIIIGNPGTGTREEYIKLNDITCVHENSNTNLSVYKWMENYNKDKFYILTYNQKSFESTIETANKHNIGYVYCTDDDLPNPWDTLPQYFNNMIK